MRRCQYCRRILAHWRTPNTKYCDRFCRNLATSERKRSKRGAVERAAQSCVLCGLSLSDQRLGKKYCSEHCKLDMMSFGGPRPPCVICGEPMVGEHRRMKAHRGACTERRNYERKHLESMVRGWKRYAKRLERTCSSCGVRFCALRMAYKFCSSFNKGSCGQKRILASVERM